VLKVARTISPRWGANRTNDDDALRVGSFSVEPLAAKLTNSSGSKLYKNGQSLAQVQVDFSQTACWVPCNCRTASTRPAHFQRTADSRASDQLIGANAWLTFIGKWDEKAETIQNTHEIDGAAASL
jgi:hypothetical protein